MREFSTFIGEAFGELNHIAGETWVVVSSGDEFRGTQSNSSGSYEDITGGTDYKREVHLSCDRSDFNGGYPAKKTIVCRKSAPNVLYMVSADASVEDDSSTLFTITLALKI